MITAMTLSILICIASWYGIIFLNIKKYCKVIYHALIVELFFSAIFTPLILILPPSVSSIMLDINAVMMLCLGVGASLIVYKKGNKTAIYYLIGYIFYLIGGVLQILTDNHLIAYFNLGKHGGEIGVMFEALFLLTGLTQKYRFEKKRHYIKVSRIQEEKIEMKDAIQEILEREVEDRTVALKTVIDELNAKNQLLIQRQEEVIRQRDILEDKKQKLNELNETKDKFFSILAHDLRSPLNSLIGFNQMILEEINNLDKAAIQLIAGKLIESSKNVLNLLDNLLFWALAQTDGLSLRIEKNNLSELTQKTIKLMEPVANQKELYITFETRGKQDTFFDYNTISTVLRNLISNAIKFSFKGQTVIVRMKEFERYHQISVIDQGIGMSHEQLTQLFKIHKKQSRKGTDQEQGTGLGLILCKEFVEKNGGIIKVESTEMKGSTFSFTIPKLSSEVEMNNILKKHPVSDN